MLLVRSPVPDHAEIVARLATDGRAVADGPLPELVGGRPERRLATLLLRLRDEQRSIAGRLARKAA
jgi:hypothetical protein